MRILFLSPAADLGGAERCLIDLIKGIKQAHPESELGVVIFGFGSLQSHLQPYVEKITTLEISDSFKKIGDYALIGAERKTVAIFFSLLKILFVDIWRVRSSLSKAICDFAPDIVHSNGIKTHILGALCAKRDWHLVWHLHDYLSGRKLSRHILRLLRSKPAACAAISASVQEDAQAALNKTNVSLIYNGIDSEVFFPGTENGQKQAREKLGFSQQARLHIGLVATYANWKGHDIFIKAIGHLRKEVDVKVAHFYIIGGSIYDTLKSQFSRQDLQDMAVNDHVLERITFIDFQKNPVATYQALDIVVHASRQPEPFGLTIVEAMACEKVVVVSAGGGARELFREGVDAWGFPCGDAKALAAVLAKIIKHPEDNSAIRKAARVSVITRFQHKRMAQDFYQLYLSISRKA